MINDTTLVNRAFDLYWKLGEVEGFRKLKEEFPNTSPEGINDLLRRLKSLKDLAFELGNSVHDNHFEKEEALKRLRSNCPDFADEIYSRAIGEGLFESMW